MASADEGPADHDVVVAAALSTHPDPAVVVGEIVGAVTEALDDGDGARPDLAIVFASGRRIADLPLMLDAIERLLAPEVTLAVSCAGVVGGGEEVEAGDAVSLWAGRIGPVQPVRLEAHHVTAEGSPAVFGLPSLRPPQGRSTPPILLVLADPFSFPAESLIETVGLAAPGVAIVGGLASAARAPGENRLWLDGTEYSDGAVGVLLGGELTNVVVSQGCRPIGDPWVITEGSGQVIGRLGGRPALERVTEMIASLEPEDRALAARGLHVGIVADERRDRFTTGDFLVRAVLGAGRDTGTVVVGARIEIGQVVQFQVRDAASATAELDALVSPDQSVDGGTAGSLVFTCTGRGTHMFPELHHDASRVAETTLGGVAGMFCAGELGPVGSQNALHGFTATVVRFLRAGATSL